MGRKAPPLYENESVEEIIDDIAEIDVKINELFIMREKRVEDLKKAIKK